MEDILPKVNSTKTDECASKTTKVLLAVATSDVGDFHDIMTRAGVSQTMAHGAFRRLVARKLIKKNGVISQATEIGRPRTIFKVTPAGVAELRRLADEAIVFGQDVKKKLRNK